MRAKHKYNLNSIEGQRRIAQSNGYRISIWDMPHLIQLMARAGILLDGVEYERSNGEIQFDNNTTITL